MSSVIITRDEKRLIWIPSRYKSRYSNTYDDISKIIIIDTDKNTVANTISASTEKNRQIKYCALSPDGKFYIIGGKYPANYTGTKTTKYITVTDGSGVETEIYQTRFAEVYSMDSHKLTKEYKYYSKPIVRELLNDSKAPKYIVFVTDNTVLTVDNDEDCSLRKLQDFSVINRFSCKDIPGIGKHTYSYNGVGSGKTYDVDRVDIHPDGTKFLAELTSGHVIQYEFNGIPDKLTGAIRPACIFGKNRNGDYTRMSIYRMVSVHYLNSAKHLFTVCHDNGRIITKTTLNCSKKVCKDSVGFDGCSLSPDRKLVACCIRKTIKTPTEKKYKADGVTEKKQAKHKITYLYSISIYDISRKTFIQNSGSVKHKILDINWSPDQSKLYYSSAKKTKELVTNEKTKRQYVTEVMTYNCGYWKRHNDDEQKELNKYFYNDVSRIIVGYCFKGDGHFIGLYDMRVDK